MIQIFTAETAARTILKRIPSEDVIIPDSMLDRIASLFGERLTPEQAVGRILQDIRQRGDAALSDWSSRIDGYSPEHGFRVSPEEMQAALAALPADQRRAMEHSAERVEAFHRRQPLTSWLQQTPEGTLGQLIRPVQRVGLYVPGGTAPLPSSVLMSAIPAGVAGVAQRVIVSPPQRGTGKVAPVILAAAALAGVEEVYCLGGAQAIGALAFGTETIRPVQKIFGPGNLFVTLAKRQVFGVVGIDGLAGPTETVVVADDSARPDWVAADLLAQAEHDILATAILITPSQALAEKVQSEVERLLAAKDGPAFSREEIIRASLAQRGGIVVTNSLEEAVDLANAYAPEHLSLSVADPWRLTGRVQSAGGIFVGEASFEVLGDYAAGPSHVMPTGGSARFASPLNVWDFVHIVSLVALDPVAAAEVMRTSAVFARAEGLDAHARAAEARLPDGSGLPESLK
jgi:histidinol dehydrogenase